MTELDYDPWRDLLRMPLGVVEVDCALGSPLPLDVREGSDCASTLRGAYRGALLRVGCLEQGPTPEAPPQHTCGAGRSCPLFWLLGPRSEPQKREHASPVSFRRIRGWDPEGAPVGLDARQPVTLGRLSFELMLWGERAVEWGPVALAALTEMGRRGLLPAPRGADRPPARYLPALRAASMAPLEAWIHRARPSSFSALRTVTLRTESLTPADLRDVPGILGNLAHELVQWRLMDRGLDAELGKRGCDAHADALRAEVTQRTHLTIEEARLDHRSLGRRHSRTNPGAFSRGGLEGEITLGGDLESAFPWLRLLELRGAGPKRSFGHGQVEVSFGGGEAVET